MKKQLTILLVVFVALGIAIVHRARAQNNAGAGANVTPVQMTTPYFTTTAITSTAAVNTATTLTIPAPPSSQYNYVCSLAYQLSVSSGGTAAASVAVSTAGNFNNFAVKNSNIGTTLTDTGVMTLFSASPGFGCAKSSAPGTATTFVSPTPATYTAWTWYATYYQAP